MKPLRLLGSVAAVAALAAALLGCTPKSQPAPDRDPVTDGVPAEVADYYGQDVDWERCAGGGEGTFYCGDITAPIDWSDPDAGDLELAVIVRVAAGESRGSLLVNPGGPGASGVDLVRTSAAYAVGNTLLDEYDVVGFDPRGVGDSTAVRCLDAADMDAYLFDVPAAERGSAEWEAELTARNEDFAAACEANSGGILSQVTTANAARDMDLLRGVLGDEQLHYLGYSYGAYLGAMYAELFPERVGRVVLDGGIDPSIPGALVGARQAVGFESALRAYLAACLESHDDCPFSGTVDDAATALADGLAAVDAAPIEATDGRVMNADAMVMGIITALYAEGNWPYLTTAIASALQGDADPIFTLVDSYYNRAGDTYLDNSTEAFSAYNCMDYPVDSPEAVADSEALVAEQAPTFAPYWSGVDLCESWPYPPSGTRDRITAEGADPILLVGTTNDPATPYEWSVALADQLSSGVLLTRVGEGHLGFNKGNLCIDEAVEAYFLDGTVPPSDVTCE
ncbi:alpha/beta hydrolase [Microbacterium dauci]|uniref:Alpha/beta hydrolase n=1 Tax=Microbacterium dauci TaxID=3048008 RepID=A0ABT6ZFE3_9MICO|nr:alpha/beta hydrolase [Microbacterium sp. LX3-4]MDJ1114882.1 alpha/beta hydrolase [Microbacterium sp. LX3-4]